MAEHCKYCGLILGVDTGWKSQSGRTTGFGVDVCHCAAPEGTPYCNTPNAAEPEPMETDEPEKLRC